MSRCVSPAHRERRARSERAVPSMGSEPFRLPEAAVGVLLMLPAILLLLLLTLYPVL